MSFWEQVAEAAARVVNCEVCRAAGARPTDTSHPGVGGLPQPGWVGPSYRPSTGVVVVLQHPAVADETYGAVREAAAQSRLRHFAQHPTVETYQRFVAQTIADVVGDPAAGKRPWRTWTHPVSTAIHDCLAPEQIAWLNVVKFRTPAGGGGGRKDVPAGGDAIVHAVDAHVRQELDVLRPAAVVAVGQDARRVVATIAGPWLTLSLKLQGASDREAAMVRDQLRARDVGRPPTEAG